MYLTHARSDYHAGEIPNSLGQLGSLETLDLSHNQLSGESLGEKVHGGRGSV